MLPSLGLALFLVSPALPAPAAATPAVTQDKAELRKEFEDRLAKVDKKDAQALFELGLWADGRGLGLEAKRVFRMVLDVEPDNKKAREALGYVLHEGEWVRERDLAKLLKKKEEAEYKEKGYVKVKGAWVHKSELAFAEMGFVKHEGQWVRLDDKKELDKGRVRHPLTGDWIEAGDLEQARSGKVQVGDKWVEADKADALHASWQDPWELTFGDFTLMTVLPLDKAREVANEVETTLLYAKKAIWNPELPLPKRFRLRLYDTLDLYRGFGAQSDDTGMSAFGCFYADRSSDGSIAVYYGAPNWGPYYLKHAAGLGASMAVLGSKSRPSTNWIHTGVGSYCERWSNKPHAQHFGRQYESKGGVKALRNFFEAFRISPDDMDETMQWNILPGPDTWSATPSSPMTSR
ncbi:MAG: hypothetical protein R3F30_00995 [Planctomycetota bacterium]